MIAILSALIPVFAVIVLGHVFKRTRTIPDAFWQPAERITFSSFSPRSCSPIRRGRISVACRSCRWSGRS